MSFLKNFNNAQSDGLVSTWIPLTEADKVSQIIDQSKDKKIAFFKHSTRCGISVGVKTDLESQWEIDADEIDFYYVDLLNHRDVSNAIAEQTGVTHQSPQLIVMQDGKVIKSITHFAINYQALEESLV